MQINFLDLFVSSLTVDSPVKKEIKDSLIAHKLKYLEKIVDIVRKM